MSDLKSRYKILKEHNLIIEFHSGNLDLDSFINFVLKITHDPLFSRDMNYLIDMRNTVITAPTDDIEKYNFFTETNFKTERKRKVAILTNSPNQMVFATLFKNLNTQKLKVIEIFSTDEKATDWLNSSHKKEIMDVLGALMNP